MHSYVEPLIEKRDGVKVSQNPTKLFMPAEQAGASKPNMAEAAKLWNEKGIDSPYFKKWFGKSKVVDENGEPLVVYHGTDKQFTSFDPEKSIGGQHWFTSDKSAIESGEVGAQGKGIIMETYLNIKKPAGWAEYDKFTIDELLGRGYDGLILPESDGTATYVAYSPEQIKSATGNRGTFDAGERNINYMPSDPKAPKRQPANRITRQAPAMPGNRFMAPAASAGAKLSERFR